MNEWANILADGDISGLTELLIVVVLVAIGLISSLVKKAMEKRAAQQKAPPEADQPSPAQSDQPQRRQLLRQRRPMESARPPERLHPAQMPSPAITDAGVPPPVPTEAMPSQQRRAPKGIRRRQALPSRRRAAVEPPSPEHAPAEPDQAAAKPAAPLDSAADLRRAIIYHEVLSQPKALRRGPEMWDM